MKMVEVEQDPFFPNFIGDLVLVCDPRFVNEISTQNSHVAYWKVPVGEVESIEDISFE